MKTILQAILKCNKQKHPLINSTHKWINQDKEKNAQYSVVSLRPHPPTNRAQNPCWRVGLLSEALPPLTHPPTGNPPLSGMLPLCTVGRYQLPRSQKQTPVSLPPFLTVVTAMVKTTPFTSGASREKAGCGGHLFLNRATTIEPSATHSGN